MLKKNTLISIVLLLSSSLAIAGEESYGKLPRISIEAQGGTAFTGTVDAMIPLMNVTNKNNLYIDLYGRTSSHSDSKYALALGLGYRRGLDNGSIAGIYGFLDQTGGDKRFLMFNPGIEYLNTVDFRVNGFIPLNRRDNLHDQGWNYTYGNYDYVSYSGHSMYDKYRFNYYEVGKGFDIEGGYHFNKNLATYLGGYHYSFLHTSGVNGIYSSIEYKISKNLVGNIEYSYDRVDKSVFLLGLRLDLFNNEDRILEPIRRLIGDPNVSSAYNRNSVLYGGNPYVPSGACFTVDDHIWFFKNSASNNKQSGITINDGTAENPLGTESLTNANLSAMNQILGGGKTSGVYLGVVQGYNNTYKCDVSGTLSIPNSINIYGKYYDGTNYIDPTTMNQMPILVGSLIFYSDMSIAGSSLYNNTYQNFILNPINAGISGSNAITIQTVSTGDISIFNFRGVIVGSQGQCDTAIKIQSCDSYASISLDGCTIYGISFGIQNNYATLNVNSSNTICATGLLWNGYGICATGIANIGGVVNINNISGETSIGNPSRGIVYTLQATGISNTKNGTIMISGNNINIYVANPALATGIDSDSGSISIQCNGSSINVTGTALVYGINNRNSSFLTISGSNNSIMPSSIIETSIYAVGIYNSGTINMDTSGGSPSNYIDMSFIYIRNGYCIENYGALNVNNTRDSSGFRNYWTSHIVTKWGNVHQYNW